MKSYEELANGICLQAFDDLCWAMSMTAPGKDQRLRRDKMIMRRDVEKFLASEWYMVLTRLPPEIIIKRAIWSKAVARLEWFTELDRARWKRYQNRKACNFDFQIGAHGRIKDRRSAEYKARVKKSRRRMKHAEKLRRARKCKQQD